MEPHVPWSEGLLAPRAACYARTDYFRSAMAAEELARFRSDKARSLQAGLLPTMPPTAP
jgi:hypothetical protein